MHVQINKLQEKYVKKSNFRRGLSSCRESKPEHTDRWKKGTPSMNLENLSGLDKARRYHCPITKSLLPQQTSKIPTQTKQYKQSYKTLDTKTTGENEQPKSRNTKGQTVDNTHYSVSGGPMTVTLHSKMLLSSTSPAENPSTGFFVRSDPRTRDRSSDEKNHISLSSGSI